MSDSETPSDTTTTAEPAIALPWPDARPDLNQLVWVLWPAVSWLLPVFVYLLMAKNGGWEILILLPLMLVIIPACGLLGLIPRRILRTAGAETAPTLISILLFVNWGSQILFGLSHRGIGDSGGLDSVLGESFDMSDSRQGMLSGTAILIALTSFCAVLLLAAVMADSTRIRTTPSWVGWVAVPAVPLLLVGLVLGMSVASTADEEAAAAAESAEWDAAQRSLVELRQEIAEDGWRISCCGMDDDDPRSYQGGQGELASMLVILRTVLEAPPEQTFDELSELVSAHGWQVDDTEIQLPVVPEPDAVPIPSESTPLSPQEIWSATLTAVDDSDRLLTIRVSASAVRGDTSSAVEIDLHTAPRPARDVVEVLWWERVDDSGARYLDLEGARFRYDEWPSLLQLNAY